MTQSNDYKECYTVCGVEPGCDFGKLRAAYRRQVKIWHPDRFAENSTDRLVAEDRIKLLNSSYHVLTKYYREHGFLPSVSTRDTEPIMSKRSNVDENTTNTHGDKAFSEPATVTPLRGRRRKKGRITRVALIIAAMLAYYFIWTSETSVDKQKTGGTTLERRGPGREDTNNATPKPVRFGLGATKSQVLRAQGAPVIDGREVWQYGDSRVYFHEGTVVGWRNSPKNPLHVGQ